MWQGKNERLHETIFLVFVMSLKVPYQSQDLIKYDRQFSPLLGRFLPQVNFLCTLTCRASVKFPPVGADAIILDNPVAVITSAYILAS